MSVRLEPHADGVQLPVKAHPGARKNALCGVHDGQLKVSVTAAPEKGKANKAILDLLAETLGLKRAQLELLSGETSARKVFLVRECSLEALAGKISAANPES